MTSPVNASMPTVGCDCIERINKHWAAQGIPALVQTSRVLSDIDTEHEAYSTRIAIGAWKSDRSSRRRLPALIAQFCPMCGAVYPANDDAPPPSSEQTS